MTTRRQMLFSAGGAALAFGAGLTGAASAETVTLPFANGTRDLVAYPGKRPLLQLTARPPQLETPFSVFDEGPFTPNDAFFVRYHLAGIPTEIDPDTYRIEIAGSVHAPFSIALKDLMALDTVELAAVHQCSGNSRGFAAPRVGGGQAGNGLMGCALWKGVPLKTLLEKAGVSETAKFVAFEGLDAPVLDDTPDFIKSLEINHALDGEVMIAWQMNGADIPWLNGYPVKLVVPGYFGTYWVKHLSRITVLDKPLDSFWMTKAYRIPDTACACVEPGAAVLSSVPINRFGVRSFITNVLDGARVAPGPLALRGIAFDGGYGITEVALSTDGGLTWQGAHLGVDLGKYAFRTWTATLTLPRGETAIQVRAVNRIGQTQPMEPLWNPSGYGRNSVETTRITAD